MLLLFVVLCWMVILSCGILCSLIIYFHIFRYTLISCLILTHTELFIYFENDKHHYFEEFVIVLKLNFFI